MPAMKPCVSPGCPELIPLGGPPRCARHTTAFWRRDTEQRGTATQRGIDDTWRKLRNAFLSAHPLCADCLKEKRAEPAAIVHHVIPHRGDDRLRLDPGNLESLCRHHHGLRHKDAAGTGYIAPKRG